MSLLLPWLTGRSGKRLRSGHVVLDVPRRGHFRQWAQLREASRQHLVPYEPEWAWDELSRAAYRRRLWRYRQDRLDGVGYAFLVFRAEDHMLVGGVTLANVRRGVTQAASLGYWIGLPFVRQGYASEAVAAMLRFAFNELELNRVEAACMPINQASIGVLTRSGFRPEGRARGYLRINGHWEDHLLFARLGCDSMDGTGGEAVRIPAAAARSQAGADEIVHEVGSPAIAGAGAEHPAGRGASESGIRASEVIRGREERAA